MTTERRRPMGMTAFTIIWAGQFVSLLGTTMTQFALTIWTWEKTGVATTIALANLFFMAPQMLMSPLAGALVDRWDRRLVMMLSDLGAGLSTVAIYLLMRAGALEVWHLYTAFAFAGAFQAFQFPAYSAAVSTMLPKEQYTRASGMLSLAQSASGIFGPVAAGVLLNVVQTSSLLLFDIVSFVVAISALLMVHIPQPEAKEVAKRSILEDSLFGFKYIIERPSLLGLQLVFFSINFTAVLCFSLMAPMILSRTGNDTLVLGSVQSAFGVGGVVGGLLLSAWGGPKRRVNGVLGGMILSSILGVTLMGLGRSSSVWIAAAFFNMIFLPLINGSNQAIWQSKVPPDMQGRVFSTRALIAQISAPVATGIAGPLADHFLLPGMMEGGRLAPLFGWLVGVGPGAGISLLFVVMGIGGILVGLGGYAFPHIRNAEDIIPDHDELVAEIQNPE
jgi:DHA3 family macrolide efflux protein-like MFS transporter